MKNMEQTLSSIIDRLAACCLASIDKYGFPRVRAMLAPRVRNGLKEFMLTTNTSSEKVAMLKKNPKACLYFFDAGRFKGIEFTGTAKIRRDKESRQAAWRNGDEMYYPGGIDDPDYSVVKFTAKNCKYYSDFKTETFDL
jgi:general stress protein 26